MNQALASFRAMRSLLFAGIFIFLASVLAAQGSSDAPQAFDLPSGDASPMLKRFADQSKKEILFDVRNVSGIKTRAVRGTLTPEQALEQMLADTGLVARKDTKTGAFAVRRETDDEAKNGGSRRANDAAEETRK